MKRLYRHRDGHTCTKKGCRTARPLCSTRAAQTQRYKKCECGAYHFPHRRGSGLCSWHPQAHRRQWEAYTGTSFDDEHAPRKAG